MDKASPENKNGTFSKNERKEEYLSYTDVPESTFQYDASLLGITDHNASAPMQKKEKDPLGYNAALLGIQDTPTQTKRVNEEVQLKTTGVNDDPHLEKEADILGAKAAKGQKANVSFVAQGIQKKVIDTPTDYKTYKQIASMTLYELDRYAKEQADWHTSSKMNKGERDTVRNILLTCRSSDILAGCAETRVWDLRDAIAIHGTSDVEKYLSIYGKAVGNQDPFELTQINKTKDAIRVAKNLEKLKTAFPAFMLKSAMQEDSFFYLQSSSLIDDLIKYYKGATPAPLFQADNGADFDSYAYMKLYDGSDPLTYNSAPLKDNIRNYHRFEAKALNALTVNFNDTSKKLPLTLILHSALDHNGAFHRDPNLTSVITNKNMNTLMIEGKETLDAVKADIPKLGKKYGINDKVDQVMIAGHGNNRAIELSGTVQDDGSGELEQKEDAVDLDHNAKKTNDLFDELIKNMANVDPVVLQGLDLLGLSQFKVLYINMLNSMNPHKRVVFNACLTNSNAVDSPIKAKTVADAQKEIKAHIKNNASLATHLQNKSDADPNSDITSIGSNSSIGQVSLIDKNDNLDIIDKDDPNATSSKLQYVTDGKEPGGSLRAVLEVWADDIPACTKAMKARVKKKGKDWDNVIITTLYSIILNKYMADPEKIRQFAEYVALYISEFKFESECRVSKLGYSANFGQDSIDLFTALSKSAEWKANDHIPLVIYQGWMKADPGNAGIKNAFLGQLQSSFNCQTARKYVDVDFLGKNGALSSLLSAESKGATMLALIGTEEKKQANCIKYLEGLLDVNDKFPTAKKINKLLGGLATEDDILIKMGKLSAKGVSKSKDKEANLRLNGGTKNTAYVDSVTLKGEIKAGGAKIYPEADDTKKELDTLTEKDMVFIFGATTDWWAIEHTAKGNLGSAFVKKTEVKQLP